MKLLFTSILLCFTTLGFGQLNMTLKSNVEYQGNGNDIWGYVAPDGTEYAVVGTTIGTRVYSLEDVTNPIERIFIPGSNSTWRDMKQWGEYAYVTADSGTDGLLIINMTGAPDNITFNFIKPEVKDAAGATIALDRCHNIFIDENGLIYLAGCQGRGIEFFDPNTDPMNPTYITSIISPYSHDAYAKDNILYASEIYDHLAIYDVSDLTDIKLLGVQETSSDFTHNAWADPTNSFAFTTDERPEGFLDAYDVTDPANIEYLDKFMPPGKAGTGTIPHNTHYHNGFLVTSWYTSGVVVVDGNKPDNLVMVAQYDTYDGPDGGFSGCWGVTPYLPSGTLIANDINSGLYVFDIDYVRACYLEGTVTDINTNATISNVDIKIINGDFDDEVLTMADGIYRTGQPTAGTFTVEYSHPLYNSVTAEVTLENGIVTIQDIKLGSLPTFNLTINVVDSITGSPIANAQILFQNEGIEYGFKTDESGLATGTVVAGDYDIFVGSWGHKNIGLSAESINEDVTLSFAIAEAYMDDYILDLGWTVENVEENNNFSGAWERAIPAGTYTNGFIFNPEADVEGDVGNMAYVTENVIGAGAGQADVDNGTTTLISPKMDLTKYENPIVTFRTWFMTGGGNGDSDDMLEFSISNGTTEVVMMTYNTNLQTWSDKFNFTAKDYVALTDNMTVKMKVGDTSNNGHLVEAGIDNFLVINNPIINVVNITKGNLELFPNPASSEITIKADKATISKIEILNTQGQIILTQIVENIQAIIPVTNFVNGTYYARITTNENEIGIYPIQVIR